jgi:Ca-activated chloride channel family protein
MIVLKVAPTMTTSDLAPTRLDRARQKIADLLALRDGMPAGLIAYSGSAHLVLPPTPDRDVVTAMAGALSPGIMPREGDRLGDAVKLAAQVLRDGGQGGSILVIADTVAPGQTEALSAAVSDAASPPVILFAMAPTPAIETDAALAAAVTALDARQVATTIDNEDVTAIARRLANAPGAPVAPGETARWQEAGWWLTPIIVLLVLMWFRRGWVVAA